MHANVGDKIVVDARHMGDRVRQGKIVAIRGAGEAVQYRVRWADGHESVSSRARTRGWSSQRLRLHEAELRFGR
jgi:hypothetical protein